jgi:hypothetical protein
VKGVSIANINFVISAEENTMGLHFRDKHVLRIGKGMNSIVV